MLWLIVWTCVTIGLASTANAQHRGAFAHERTPHAAMAGMQAMSAENTGEIESHGHRHSGNPLRDLLTLGHTLVGCGCSAGVAIDVMLWRPIPYGDTTVPLWTMPSVSDGRPTYPFRPPIA